MFSLDLRHCRRQGQQPKRFGWRNEEPKESGEKLKEKVVVVQKYGRGSFFFAYFLENVVALTDNITYLVQT